MVEKATKGLTKIYGAIVINWHRVFDVCYNVVYELDEVGFEHIIVL